MYAPVRTVAPATTPVSVSEAKAHLRVDGSDEDTLIGALVASATSHLDGYSGVLGRAIITQTWRQDFDDFSTRLRLPLFPVASISSVTYRDANGTTQTVSAANYALLCDDRGYYVRFIDDYDPPIVYDDGPAVSVTYVAEATAPPGLMHAIKLLVGAWFADREAGEIPRAVDRLLTPFRRIGV